MVFIQNEKRRAKTDGKDEKKVTRKPPRFSWIVPGQLAGHGRPTTEEQLKFLCQNGIKYIVTLTQHKPRALQDTAVQHKWIHIPIQDEKAPTTKQIEQFCRAVEKAKEENVGISVHCAWGRGRTGTMIACYLCKSRQISADEAVKEVRRLRKGSIDTEVQIEAIKKWAASMKTKVQKKTVST